MKGGVDESAVAALKILFLSFFPILSALCFLLSEEKSVKMRRTSPTLLIGADYLFGLIKVSRYAKAANGSSKHLFSGLSLV